MRNFPAHSWFRLARVASKRNRLMATPSYVRRAASAVDETHLEAVEAVREVRDNLAQAIDKSLARRPYTTLAMALGFGFMLGALWAR
jgi:ElaB/YqjD/DUF883 family membrane-anchored ribosome-binding protein